MAWFYLMIAAVFFPAVVYKKYFLYRYLYFSLGLS